MLAIHTKFVPATNTRSARIKAYTCNGHSVTIPLDLELSDVKRHFKAVQVLLKQDFPYAEDEEKMAYGSSADGKGYCFCFVYSTVLM